MISWYMYMIKVVCNKHGTTYYTTVLTVDMYTLWTMSSSTDSSQDRNTYFTSYWISW